MKNRQLWILLALIAFILAIGWAVVEALCGAKTVPASAPGDPPQPARCVSTITPYPYVILGAALVALAVLKWAPDLVPEPEKKQARLIVRTVGWTLVTLVFGFAVLDLVGIGLFVLPFAIILLIVALWPHDSGRWAVLGGSVLVLLSAALQYFDLLYTEYSEPLAAQVQHLRVDDLPLLVFGAGGALAVAGALLWPRWWCHIFMVAGVAGVWAAPLWPGHRTETTIFLLPGALLTTLGAVRSVVGYWVLRPAPPTKPTAADELDAQRA